MPNAECRMPNAECRMPNAECRLSAVGIERLLRSYARGGFTTRSTAPQCEYEEAQKQHKSLCRPALDKRNNDQRRAADQLRDGRANAAASWR